MHDPHLRPRRPVRPGRRQRQAIYAGTALLLGSGLLWLLPHYALPLPEDAARHPVEPWAMYPRRRDDVRAGRARRNLGKSRAGCLERGTHRWSGGSLLGLWLGLALSGYGLYYLADEAWRGVASWLHVAAGVGLPATLAIHVWKVTAGRKPARSGDRQADYVCVLSRRGKASVSPRC